MEQINLLNYRCFKNMTLVFKKNVNVLIGDNSSGKTTILRALSQVMSTFFTGYSDEHTRLKGLSIEDFSINNSQTGLKNQKPVSLKFVLLGTVSVMNLVSTKSKTQKRPLESIFNLGKHLQNNLFEGTVQVLALPLFASFSTNDIHGIRKISFEPFKQYLHKPSFGYFECLQGDGLLPYWTKRLLVLKEGETGDLEMWGVLRAVMDALDDGGCGIINDMHVRPQQGQVHYFTTDGRMTTTENLSDGYKRLVNIVVDLAFRCMLLNQGIYGDQACKKTEGTVLIDEIDLHLHPSLQGKVLPGLRRAFPRLQFIVSTHAPMVMTGVKIDEECIIYKLNYSRENDYTATPVELYGLDASTIMEVALHTIPRSKDVDEQLKTLFNFIDTDQYVEASNLLREMRKQFGDNLPELAKAEAMLNFLNQGETDPVVKMKENDQDK